MKNKTTRNIVIIVIICFFGLCICLYQLVLNTNYDNKAIYGDRLDGIDSVKISSKLKKEIIKNVNDTTLSKETKINIQGKIINVTIIVNDDVSIENAKPLADKVLEKLGEEEKKFYDIQVFIKKDNEDEKFPIIGYHHPKKEGFSWTLDR